MTVDCFLFVLNIKRLNIIFIKLGKDWAPRVKSEINGKLADDAKLAYLQAQSTLRPVHEAKEFNFWNVYFRPTRQLFRQLADQVTILVIIRTLYNVYPDSKVLTVRWGNYYLSLFVSPYKYNEVENESLFEDETTVRMTQTL